MRRIQIEHPAPLLEFLLANLGQSRKSVKNLLRTGAIAVNNAVVRQFDWPLKSGDRLTVGNLHSAVQVQRLEHAHVQIVFEDPWLLVVDKPVGLLTVATEKNKTNTLFTRMTAYLNRGLGESDLRPHVVHRLDQETSGLVLFAKDEATKQSLQRDWQEVEKIYLAVVDDTPEVAEQTISSYLTESKSVQVYSHDHPLPGGKLATTHYRLLQSRGDLSLLEVRLGTGRKHQIRVHLSQLGHPVAGDRRYHSTSNPCRRLCLHAHRLKFAHPHDGQPVSLISPMPARFSRLFPVTPQGR